MAWITDPNGKYVWDGDAGVKRCKHCGEIIRQPDGYKKLDKPKRVGFINKKWCSSICKTNAYLERGGIQYKAKYRRENKEKIYEWQKKYKQKHKEKINSKRRLVRFYQKYYV